MTFFKDLLDGIKAVFKGKDVNNIYKINGRVPLSRAIPFGIQHVLAMFVANVTPLLIVFGGLGIYGTDLATSAMTGALFMAGIGTAVQVFIGAKLPIVIGTSFTFVGIFTSIGTSAGGGEGGYYLILGSVMAGGLISSVLCLFIKWWGRLIKPIVPCVVVLAIGLSLVNSGATQFLGGQTVVNGLVGDKNPQPVYVYIIIAAATLLSAVFWQIFAKGVWKNLNIIFGMAVGYVICLFVPNVIDFSALQIKDFSDVIFYPEFADIAKFRFEPIPILLTTIFFLISVVEGIGDATAICRGALNREPTNREITGTLVADGFNSFLCSFFGALPLTTFAQNVSIVTSTKAVNRFTVFIGSLFLIAASFFPIISNFLLTIPDCVIGGTMVILFGSIAVVGMEMCAKQGFSAKNVLIISLSLCLGFGLTTVTGLFTYLNEAGLNYLADMLSNNVLNMFVISFILSWILPDDMNFTFKKRSKFTDAKTKQN